MGGKWGKEKEGATVSAVGFGAEGRGGWALRGSGVLVRWAFPRLCACVVGGGHTMTFPSSGRPKSEKQPPARPPCADGFQGLVGNSARVAIAFLCRVTRTG